MGYDGTSPDIDHDSDLKHFDDSTRKVSEENCEWEVNATVLTPGEFHLIDSDNYEYSVTVWFQSDIAAGANHTPNINYFAMTESNYNDFVACEPFIPINVYDVYGKFGEAKANTSSPYFEDSYTDISLFDERASWNHVGFSDNTLLHNPYSPLETLGDDLDNNFADYDEPIYLVLDNWHCEEEKYDGTAIGDIYLNYRIGVQTGGER